MNNLQKMLDLLASGAYFAGQQHTRIAANLANPGWLNKKTISLGHIAGREPREEHSTFPTQAPPFPPPNTPGSWRTAGERCR